MSFIRIVPSIRADGAWGPAVLAFLVLGLGFGISCATSNADGDPSDRDNQPDGPQCLNPCFTADECQPGYFCVASCCSDKMPEPEASDDPDLELPDIENEDDTLGDDSPDSDADDDHDIPPDDSDNGEDDDTVADEDEEIEEREPFDPEPGSFYVRIREPAQGDYVRDRFQVRVDVPGGTLAPGLVTYSILGGPSGERQIASASAGDFSAEIVLSRNDFPDGEYRLKAVANQRSSATVRAEDEIRIKIDREPPQVTILEPAEGDTRQYCAGETLLVRFEVRDNMGLKSVDLTVGETTHPVQLVPGRDTYTQSVPIDPTVFRTGGAHQVRVVARDFGAATGPSNVVRTFTVDQSGPQFSVEGLDLAATPTIPTGPFKIKLSDCSGFGSGARVVMKRFGVGDPARQARPGGGCPDDGGVELPPLVPAAEDKEVEREYHFDDFLGENRQYPYDLQICVSLADPFGNATSDARSLQVRRRAWPQGVLPPPLRDISTTVVSSTTGLALTPDENTVVGGMAYSFFGMSATNGQIQWSCQTRPVPQTVPQDYGYIRSNVALAGTMAFAADDYGYLYARENPAEAGANENCVYTRFEPRLVHKLPQRPARMPAGPTLTAGPSLPGTARMMACGVRQQSDATSPELICSQWEYRRDATSPDPKWVKLCETTGFPCRTSTTDRANCHMAGPGVYADWFGTPYYFLAMDDRLFRIDAWQGAAPSSPQFCPVTASQAAPSDTMGGPLFDPTESTLFAGLGRLYIPWGLNLAQPATRGRLPDDQPPNRSGAIFTRASPVIGPDGRHFMLISELRNGSASRLVGFKPPFVDFNAAPTVLLDVPSFSNARVIEASPVIGADGILYTADNSQAGVIHAVDTGTASGSRPAKLLWSMDTRENPTSQPDALSNIRSDLVMDRRGIVYFVSDNLRVHAVRTSSPGPAATAWPMAGGNAQRWGVARNPAR